MCKFGIINISRHHTTILPQRFGSLVQPGSQLMLLACRRASLPVANLFGRLRSAQTVLLSILGGVNIKDQVGKDLLISLFCDATSNLAHVVFIILHGLVPTHSILYNQLSQSPMSRLAYILASNRQ